MVAGQFVDFLSQISRLPVVDNGSIHVSQVVREARAVLRQQRIYLYYLPPYSPELNAIEAVFGVITRDARSLEVRALAKPVLHGSLTTMATACSCRHLEGEQPFFGLCPPVDTIIWRDVLRLIVMGSPAMLVQHLLPTTRYAGLRSRSM